MPAHRILKLQRDHAGAPLSLAFSDFPDQKEHLLKELLSAHLHEIIGFLATLCTISSFLPQALKIKRERNADSVSLKMYAITVTGFALWTTYGVLLKSTPLILANAASLAISLWILLLKLRYTHHGAE